VAAAVFQRLALGLRNYAEVRREAHRELHLRLLDLDTDLVHVWRHQGAHLLADLGSVLQCLLESVTSEGGPEGHQCRVFDDCQENITKSHCLLCKTMQGHQERDEPE
jgi:hypothetical protein